MRNVIDATQCTGGQLFNSFMHGLPVLIEGNVYTKRSYGLPSQCGGRMIEITPTAFNVDGVTRVTPPTHPCLDVLPCSEAGLLFVNAMLPESMRHSNAFKSMIERWADFLEKRYSHLRVSFALPTLTVTAASCPLANHRWFNAVISVANVDAHEGRYESGETTCSECGEQVYGEGDWYCEECDWYTEPSESYEPEEDYDLGLDISWGNNVEHIFTEEQMMDEIYDHDNPEDTPFRFVWSHDYVTSNVMTYMHARPMFTGLVPFTLRGLAHSLLPSVMHCPVVISSNLAEAPYMTPDLMAYIFRNRSELRDTYGIEVVTPELSATNPNERNHYVHGMLLVPYSRDLLLETLRDATLKRGE